MSKKSASEELMKQLTFLHMLRHYGGTRVWLSFDMIGAVLVATTVLVWGWKSPASVHGVACGLAAPIMQISASFLGLIIAAFAISAGVSDRKFAELLERHNLLRNLLFPFWLTSVVWFGVLVLTLLIEGYMILDGSPSIAVVITTAMAAASLLFGLIASIRLVGTILRLAIFRALLSSLLDKNQKSNDEEKPEDVP